MYKITIVNLEDNLITDEVKVETFSRTEIGRGGNIAYTRKARPTPKVGDIYKNPGHSYYILFAEPLPYDNWNLMRIMDGITRLISWNESEVWEFLDEAVFVGNIKDVYTIPRTMDSKCD